MATVSIACKLPNGAHIQLRQSIKTKDGEMSEYVGERVTLNGMNASAIIGGHGITHGVDKEFFDKWMAQNKDAAFVKNGLVFAHEKADSVAAKAVEQASNVSGFEGVDPSKPGPGLKQDDGK